MSGRDAFIDTNILVYAYDRDAGAKHEAARDILVDLWNQAGGLLSLQVLQEFFVTVTRKIPNPLPLRLAREIVEDLLTWRVVGLDGQDILGAIDVQERESLHFWDALIVRAAQKARAAELFSEDFGDGRSFGDIKVRNPFGRG